METREQIAKNTERPTLEDHYIHHHHHHYQYDFLLVANSITSHHNLQLSSILAVFTLAAASAHAALNLAPNHEAAVELKEACAALNEVTSNSGVEKRACGWGSCDGCYERYGYCVGCNRGQALPCINCMAYCEDNCC
ncbi:hypothetical protein MFIFM68171_05039 [Madurella fahalii]|uniref:Uncharacterized protein n=1 Tax=Madurella fahalii TaxID=1157608 RepID=A0ABQ0GAQ3_9PEZI